MTDRELLEMALKTLAVYMELPSDHWPGPPTTAYVALRARLAQPDLAKVGEVGAWGEPVIDKSAAKRIATQLGWAPKREWQGLTDEEYTELWGKKPDLLNFFRKIEAKLKEKNHG